MHHLKFPAVRHHRHNQESSLPAKFTTRSALEKYFKTIIEVLLNRLQHSKTDTFVLRFVRLYHFISSRDDKGLGADFFINITEQIQSG